MNIAFALEPNAIEAQLTVGTAVIGRLDTLFPVESPAKATGVFSSDCCSSNNYDEQQR